MPPPITTRYARHNKSTMTKPSYSQAYESTADSKKSHNASTSNKRYGSYTKVTICSLTSASPKLRMNA